MDEDKLKKSTTTSGAVIPGFEDAAAPGPTNPDTGMHVAYWVLSAEERAKGFVRPVRNKYIHVGMPAPKFPLRDLTEAELKSYSQFGYIKFEEIPLTKESTLSGRYWTQKDLDRINKGCGVVTTMSTAISETYARDPSYYGSTFCCGCRVHLPVGERGEFVWDETPETRVGT